MIRPSPRVLVFADTDALAAVAAETVVQEAVSAVARHGRFVLALSGGSTPQVVYRLLAAPAYDQVLPWSATVVLWGDERCVPRDHADSNFGMVARTGLLDRPFAAVERIRGELGAAEAANDYERRLRALGGSPSPEPGATVAAPAIDLVLLGVGDDGHTASLLPGAPSLAESRRLVVATDEYAGVRRVTLTLPVLAAAGRLLFIVAGERKATAVAEILGDPSSPLPAAVALRTARSATMLLDRAAAGAGVPGAAAEVVSQTGDRGLVAPDPGVV